MSTHIPQTLIATSQVAADLLRLIEKATQDQGAVQEHLVHLAGVATHLDSYDKADLAERIGAFGDSVDNLINSLSNVIEMLEGEQPGTGPTAIPEDPGFTPGP
jgi:hypothetical protein